MNRIILIFTVLAALVPTAMSNVSAPSAAYSQVAELNNISTSTQCLDFNQDGICESIVLVNGTVINNPDVPVIAPTINGNNITNSTAATATVGVEVDENDPCGGGVEYKLDGEIFCTPEEYEDARKIQYEQEQGEKEYPRPLLTEYMPKPSSSNDNNNDDDNDDKGDEDSDDGGNPYCDELATPYSEDCFDRKDYDQETGLYPCKDGSYVGDWRDCTGGGSNNDDDDNDNDLPNCNDVEYGTRCDGSEDEDSTLDDETEYEDDGYIDEDEDGQDDDEEEDSGGDEGLFG